MKEQPLTDPRLSSPFQPLGPLQRCGPNCRLMQYHTHRGLLRDMEQLAKSFPRNAETFHVGQSRRGRDLVGIR